MISIGGSLGGSLRGVTADKSVSVDVFNSAQSAFPAQVDLYYAAKAAFKSNKYDEANEYAYAAYSDIMDALYSAKGQYSLPERFGSAQVAYRAINLALDSELANPVDGSTGAEIKSKAEYEKFVAGVLKFGYLELAEDALSVAKSAAKQAGDQKAIDKVASQQLEVQNRRDMLTKADSAGSVQAAIVESKPMSQTTSNVLLAGLAVVAGVAVYRIVKGR